MNRRMATARGKRRNVSKFEYQKFIKGLSLDEFKIVALEASVQPDFGVPADLKIQDKSVYESLGGNRYRVNQTYTLRCTKKGDKKPGFIVEVTYVLCYTAKTPIKEAYFDIFRRSSLRLQTWSYFRQLVHQLSMYMNLPPLVLDIMKISL